VKGQTDNTLIVKKAPPYVRVLPEWPMSETRIQFECQALEEQVKWAPAYVPKIHAFDPAAAIIVMEYLSPHIILRKGLMAATEYPHLATHMADFLANTLFHTSTLFLKNTEQRTDFGKYVANSMIHVTEQLVFFEPYMTAKNNHWTDHENTNNQIKLIQEDVQLKLAVAHYHEKFQNCGQALIHADLHTGSIMVTPEKTAVIDAEFAYYGPMGFDIGAFIGNLFLSYFSQDGLATQDEKPLSRTAYKEWLLNVVVLTWDQFVQKFLHLWDTKHKGSLYVHFGVDAPEAERKLAQSIYIKNLFADSIAFAGIKMIRRIIGFAHVADLESIVDIPTRSKCEVQALKFGRSIIVGASKFENIKEIIQLAQSTQ